MAYLALYLWLGGALNTAMLSVGYGRRLSLGLLLRSLVWPAFVPAFMASTIFDMVRGNDL